MSYRLRFPANESPRRTGLHRSLSGFYLPAFEISHSCRTASDFSLCCVSALNGMLYKLAPKPVENLYLPDAPDVKAAKEEFLKLFRNSLDSLMITVK
jgi:hypothetical protein